MTHNDRLPEPRKLSGAVSYGNLVLKRGVIGSLDLYEWWDQSRNGRPDAYRDVTVMLQGEDRQAVVLTWRFARARPVSYGFEPLGISPCGPAVEVLELGFERMELE